jgi:hypothetical protein
MIAKGAVPYETFSRLSLVKNAELAELMTPK